MRNPANAEDDPLWKDFLEFVQVAQKNKVEPHSPLEQMWVVFKAGGDAEHKRVVGCFKDVAINVEKIPGFEVQV